MASADPNPVVLVIMGVSGSGKSTIASLLSDRLGWPFEEGDSLHPEANVEKMAAGHPLTDEDRWPWLEKVGDWIHERLDAGGSGIITCSALKRVYRDRLTRGRSGIVFVYLAGDNPTIARRLAARHGHFMPPTLLDSQFADLEEPAEDETYISVDVRGTPDQIAEEVIRELHLTSKGRTT